MIADIDVMTVIVLTMMMMTKRRKKQLGIEAAKRNDRIFIRIFNDL